MSFIKSIFNASMAEPQIYGWFHLMFLAFVAIGSAVLIATSKNASNKKQRIILFVFSAILVVMEIYKQFSYSFNFDTGVWTMKWWIFPFQFCSTPMYVALVASFLKEGKFQKSLMFFLATYSLFGGLAVMLYPGDVFSTITGINFQTMIHHGLQVVVGLWLAVVYRKEINFKSLIMASFVFLGLTTVALSLNIVAYHLPTIVDGTFNMFFISPYYPSTLPVVSIVYSIASYPVFLISYIIGFGLIAGLVTQVINKLNKISENRKLKTLKV